MELINNKELKQMQLNILEAVDMFCTNNNINYFLAGGTLIGAIRHKGFIPWDDDIDIYMPRPDYDIFLNKFNGYNKQFKVVSFEIDDKFLYAFAKVVDTNTVLIENVRDAYKLGVNIDLFPIDGISDKNKILLIKQIFLTNLLGFKIIKLSKERALYKNVIILISRLMLWWLPTEKIIKKIISNSKKNDYFSSSKVCVLTQGTKKNKIYNKSVFSETITWEFEGKIFRIPKGYQAYLEGAYGDYMKLPPERERVAHHSFEAYKIV